jgi:hypothetical protein
MEVSAAQHRQLTAIGKDEVEELRLLAETN